MNPNPDFVIEYALRRADVRVSMSQLSLYKKASLCVVGKVEVV